MKLLLNNEYYEVIIEKKNNKNLYIRVKDDMKIYVTCSFLCSDRSILNILEKNKSSILNMINKQKKKHEEKKEQPYNYLGSNLDVVFCNIFSKPKYEDNKLYVKDKNEVKKWYLMKAKEVFQDRLDMLYDSFNEKIPYPKLKIRSMKTRWGVCNKKDNSVTLNLELITKDIKYLDYVIIHELSHFIHFNHSAKFWNLVSKYYPEYKSVRKEMRD